MMFLEAVEHADSENLVEWSFMKEYVTHLHPKRAYFLFTHSSVGDYDGHRSVVAIAKYKLLNFLISDFIVLLLKIRCCFVKKIS